MIKINGSFYFLESQDRLTPNLRYEGQIDLKKRFILKIVFNCPFSVV